MTRKRGPSERQRAMWALAGFFVPAEGDEGRWSGPPTPTAPGTVLVLNPKPWVSVPVRITRVAATGTTVWVKFLGKAPRGLVDRRKTEHRYSWLSRVKAYVSAGGAHEGPYGRLDLPHRN